jgi:hypothetical protein
MPERERNIISGKDGLLAKTFSSWGAEKEGLFWKEIVGAT